MDELALLNPLRGPQSIILQGEPTLEANANGFVTVRLTNSTMQTSL